jgi:copper chaperone NosL
MHSWQRFLLVLAITLLAGCSGDPGSGPKPVNWDRDSCERCRMVLSDRVHSAQVRYQPEGKKRSKVLMFDDIGCAVLWLEDKPWKDDPATELWVADYRNGQWIDARSAYYVTGRITPMEYGLGALPEKVPGAFDFTQAKAHIYDVEKRFNAHGTDLLQRLQELREKRESAGAQDQSQHNPDETKQ